MSWGTYFISFVTFVVLGIFILARRSKFTTKRVGIPPDFLGLNLSAAKKEFAVNGHRLVDECYHKFKNENFYVQTQDMERLIVSPRFLPELRMLPEDKLSHSAALVEKFLGDYSQMNIILESHQHSEVCRVHLTRCLRYKAVPSYGYVYSMVLAVSSRVFVGLPLAHDRAWLDIISSYLSEVVATGNALRPWPRFLRPLLRPFLAPRSLMDAIIAKALEVLVPAIEERQRLGDTQTDLLGYLVQTSDAFDPKSIILKLLVLNAAALHTSTMAAVHTLFDLCERPHYMKALRMESRKALDEDRGAWKLDTVKKLRKLDSFMKESMRCNRPDALAFNRIVHSPITLSNGDILQPGTFINMASESMARDPVYYTDPLTFDGYRFFSEGATQPSNEFTGIEPGNLAWGSGRLTCPGRWYASAMNKMIVASLLVQYEIKFPEGQTKRPANLYSNGGIMPDPSQVLLFRKLD